MNSAWIGVIGVLGGVIVTAATTIATTWFSQRSSRELQFAERREARRQELKAVYTTFLVAAQRFYGHLSTLELGEISELTDEKKVRARLEERLDPTIRIALEESSVAAQLLSDGLYDEISNFLIAILDEALNIAMTGQPLRGGYNQLQKPLLRGMSEELNALRPRDAGR